METQNILLYLWLATSFPYGSSLPCKILKHYEGDLTRFFEKLEIESKNFKITEKSMQKLRYKDLKKCENIVKVCESLGIEIVCFFDKAFPERIKNIKTAPIVLYYFGNLKISFAPCVGVIGTRRCNQFGLQAAKAISQKLVEYGITTVSGCAKGIDGSIHSATVEAGGKTIAVLGTPLDSPYPFENKIIRKKIAESGGLIISEYPPYTKTAAWHFPIRNRIISAMSDCVVVVQSREKSGTFITAKKTLELNKKVFCIPPPNIFIESTQGIEKCLQQGAELLVSFKDILKVFENSKYKPVKKSINKADDEKTKNLPKEFIKLLNLIEKEERLDYILKKASCKTNETLFILTQLELLKLVEKTKTGYKRC